MRGPVALAAVAAALAVALVPAGARGATARSGSSRTDATVCPTDTWGTSVTDAGHVGWIRSLPASPTGGGLPGPVNAAGVVIFAGDSDLTAFRNAGGGRLWNIHLNPVNGEPASFAGLWASTTAAYTLVKYSVAGKPTERLVELDPNTGKTLWGISLGGDAENVNANGNVYGFAVGGTIVAVDTFTNRVLWRQKFGRPARDGSYNTQLAWTAVTSSPCPARPRRVRPRARPRDSFIRRASGRGRGPAYLTSRTWPRSAGLCCCPTATATAPSRPFPDDRPGRRHRQDPVAGQSQALGNWRADVARRGRLHRLGPDL